MCRVKLAIRIPDWIEFIQHSLCEMQACCRCGGGSLACGRRPFDNALIRETGMNIRGIGASPRIEGRSRIVRSKTPNSSASRVVAITLALIGPPFPASKQGRRQRRIRLPGLTTSSTGLHLSYLEGDLAVGRSSVEPKSCAQNPRIV